MEWMLPTTSAGTCLGMELTLTDVTAGTPVDLLQGSYQYTNSAGVPRQFQLDSIQIIETPPAPPSALFSPRTGTSSVLLAWNAVGDPAIIGSHVYRKVAGSTAYQRLTTTPTTTTKFVDNNVTAGSYSYLVTSVTAGGCESGPSNVIDITVGP